MPITTLMNSEMEIGSKMFSRKIRCDRHGQQKVSVKRQRTPFWREHHQLLEIKDLTWFSTKGNAGLRKANNVFIFFPNSATPMSSVAPVQGSCPQIRSSCT